MTLRVKIEIVPFGEEEKVREIRRFNISNLGDYELGVSFYGVEVDKYKSHEYDFTVTHKRSDGAEALVNKVLERFLAPE